MASRATLAMIEAAAIDRHLASPCTMVRVAHSTFGALLPSTRTSLGGHVEPRHGLSHRP